MGFVKRICALNGYHYDVVNCTLDEGMLVNVTDVDLVNDRLKIE